MDLYQYSPPGRLIVFACFFELVCAGHQNADRMRRGPGLGLGQRHFVEVTRFGWPRRRPLGSDVAAGVFRQVVAAHEAPLAHVAHKLLLSGVRPPVPGEFVGTCKLFVAALPVAAEGFFT